MTSPSAVAPSTRRAHWEHPVAGSYVATQGWTLRDDGKDVGDALVVCVHSLTNNALPVILVRMGDTVRALRAGGLHDALTNGLGVDPKSIRVA